MALLYTFMTSVTGVESWVIELIKEKIEYG